MDLESRLEQPANRQLGSWQFGLHRLMTITFWCAVFLAAAKWWGMSGVLLFLVLGQPFWLRRPGHPVELNILKSLVFYCVASSMTLPFLDAIWFGEIPPLAIIHSPKTEFGNWIRSSLVMPAIKWLGYSRGSFSPDYILARPYALALAYFAPLVLLCGGLWWRTGLVPPYRRWFCVLLILAVLDFCLMLIFAGGPGFTIY